jgi:N-acetylmuramoyl-L-alanine amidase
VQFGRVLPQAAANVQKFFGSFLQKRTLFVVKAKMLITDLPSPNQDDRPLPVDMLILHYTGMQSAQAAIDRLRDPAAKVSSHYVVDEDGAIYRLVAEEQRAYHAGISYWRGRTALNDCSIGIEIVNPGHEWGYRPFPDAQMQAVRSLCLEILARHAIPARNVVGHSDVAPNRKQDPGELFPWRWLAGQGVGLWADVPGADQTACGAPEIAYLRDRMAELGYDSTNLRHADHLATTVTAFQRHWRPEAVTGVPDTGTLARLRALLP